MIIVWTTQTDKKVLDLAIKKTLQKYKIPHQVKITSKLVTSKDHTILALGGQCVETLQKYSLLPKGRKIGSLRNTLHDTEKGSYFVSYDPAVQHSDYAWWMDLKMDLNKVCRYVKTGSIIPKLGDYKEVDDFRGFYEKTLDTYNKTGKKVEVACDLETLGLDAWKEDVYIISVQMTQSKGTADVLYVNDTKGVLTGEQKKWIVKILNASHIKIEGANFKYDLIWFWVKWKISCSNFTLDTHLLGSLFNENISNSLNTHAKLYTKMGGYDDKFNDTYDKGRMDLVPKADVINYGGGDTDACWRVAKVFRKSLKKNKKMRRFYAKVLHPACRVFEDIEKVGVFIDVEVYAKLRKSVVTDIEKDKKTVKKLLPKALREKHKEKFNPKKPALIKDYMFGFYDDGKPMGLGLKPKLFTAKAKTETWKDASTAGNHLLMMRRYKKAHIFLDAIETYGSSTKTLQTYIDGFLAHLRSDGRYHPTYFLFKGRYEDSKGKDGGTNTGRTSVIGPAMQTLPKRTKWAKPLRAAYIAPNGYCILAVDYSEGELRIAADRSNDKEMIDAYNNGLSLHAKTAAGLNDITIEDFMALKISDYDKYDLLRFGAKAGNFGLIYGMQVNGFQTYCRDVFGLNYSLQECQKRRDKFFNIYPGLLDWHEREVTEARAKGYVENQLGRVRHLPMLKSWKWEVYSKEERRAINAPVQSCLNDLLFYSLVKFKERYGKYIENREILPFLTVHDQILFYVRNKYKEDWAKNVVDVMSTLPLKKEFGWKPKVVFEADAELGLTLAKMNPVKF